MSAPRNPGWPKAPPYIRPTREPAHAVTAHAVLEASFSYDVSEVNDEALVSLDDARMAQMRAAVLRQIAAIEAAMFAQYGAVPLRWDATLSEDGGSITMKPSGYRFLWPPKGVP